MAYVEMILGGGTIPDITLTYDIYASNMGASGKAYRGYIDIDKELIKLYKYIKPYSVNANNTSISSITMNGQSVSNNTKYLIENLPNYSNGIRIITNANVVSGASGGSAFEMKAYVYLSNV